MGIRAEAEFRAGCFVRYSFERYRNPFESLVFRVDRITLLPSLSRNAAFPNSERVVTPEQWATQTGFRFEKALTGQNRPRGIRCHHS